MKSSYPTFKNINRKELIFFNDLVGTLEKYSMDILTVGMLNTLEVADFQIISVVYRKLVLRMIERILNTNRIL